MSKSHPERVASVVCAYVMNNRIPLSDLPSLIATVADALKLSHQPLPPVSGAPSSSQIAQSITPKALISFIDGKPYKTLKRHLRSKGYTPESYRAAFGLPDDYPMICANYSQVRSDLALGRHRDYRAAA